MTATEHKPSQSYWWLESLLWSLGIAAAIGTAAYLNETAREITLQGLAYFFTFFSTPFVLEASTAFVGFCIVMIVNNRRLEREGDGWVEMEIQMPMVADEPTLEQELTNKAVEV
jgi:hypothetical protein